MGGEARQVVLPGYSHQPHLSPSLTVPQTLMGAHPAWALIYRFSRNDLSPTQREKENWSCATGSNDSYSAAPPRGVRASLRAPPPTSARHSLPLPIRRPGSDLSLPSLGPSLAAFAEPPPPSPEPCLVPHPPPAIALLCHQLNGMLQQLPALQNPC